MIKMYWHTELAEEKSSYDKLPGKYGFVRLQWLISGTSELF